MNRVYDANQEQINRIISSFDDEFFITPPQWATHCIHFDDCVITIYQSGKVMFQGKNADLYSTIFFPIEPTTMPQAGSDEVGTGDYFGPVCVCACYVDAQIYERIKHLSLVDSKQLSDSQIVSIAPQLLKEVPHSLLVLDNVKYNMVNASNNMNQIKAKMHNKCYVNLKKKGIALPELMVIDDFCGERNYYSYVHGEPEIIENIHFETKAENKFISVACGAIIARYSFLYYLQKMSEKYGCQFPKGAGAQVDEFARMFVQKFSREELNNVAKINFKNTSKIEATE